MAHTLLTFYANFGAWIPLIIVMALLLIATVAVMLLVIINKLYKTVDAPNWPIIHPACSHFHPNGETEIAVTITNQTKTPIEVAAVRLTQVGILDHKIETAHQSVKLPIRIHGEIESKSEKPPSSVAFSLKPPNLNPNAGPVNLAILIKRNFPFPSERIFQQQITLT